MAEAMETDEEQEHSIQAIWKYLQKCLSQINASGECGTFTIMVVGETGSGKSCLINNLLGQDVAEEGHKVFSQTSTVEKYEMIVNNVPVVVYDTPGLSDTDAAKDKQHIEAVKNVLKKQKIQLFIYCQKLSENRMRNSLILTLKQYREIGVDWTQTIIALTFADSIPVPGQLRSKDGFDKGIYFAQKLEEWQKKVRCTLVEQVGLEQEVVKVIKIRPTSADRDDDLPNGEGWYIPLWLDILEILTPGEMVRFLEIQNGHVIVHLDEEQKGRLMKILQMKMERLCNKAKKLYGDVMSFIKTTLWPWGQKTQHEKSESKECAD